MFWSLRENLCGLNHMGRLAGRLILRRPRFYYLDRLKAQGFAVSPVLDDLGQSLNCRLCGYTNLRFDLTSGFEMTACSSLARSVLLHKDKLNLWSEGLVHSSKEAVEIARQAKAEAGAGSGTIVKGSPGAESVV